MYPLKTKEEHYQEYMNGIFELEMSIASDELEIEKRFRSMDKKQERIEGLKEMAELYAPKEK